ncbi:MAG: hypothetical protein AAF827_19110 [Cyanobacteria bacterium P01_D01_bin.6]
MENQGFGRDSRAHDWRRMGRDLAINRFDSSHVIHDAPNDAQVIEVLNRYAQCLEVERFKNIRLLFA